MLDLLIAASKDNQINDEGIQEEVDTFMFAVRKYHIVCSLFRKVKNK